MNIRDTDPPIAARAPRRVQINVSPHAGEADFAGIEGYREKMALDPVSIADLLRNGFVYPPHTIHADVKAAITGFDPAQDLYSDPVFHFKYQSALARARPSIDGVDCEQVIDTYHRLLCEAVSRSTDGMRSPWLLQSGGKDSTSVAIAMAEAAPRTTCITYLGGAEENEIASAQQVARKLGLRHESLACDPGRAYDRYLAMVPRLPLLTADFALLSYVDLAVEIKARGGDGMLDSLGSDAYFGLPIHWQQRAHALLSRRLRLPPGIFDSDVVGSNFLLCYVLGTLQMEAFERCFPGSRFTDSEVDALCGRKIAVESRKRIETFRPDLLAAGSMEARRRISTTVLESAMFAKGMYTASALSLRVAYPFCDMPLCNWIFDQVPDAMLIGPKGTNKVLVRRHIARHFQNLPYVAAKGSFRFNLVGLARERYDQVHEFAMKARHVLPGAPDWLARHRHRMHNKYFASKFYLLAVTLPWLLSRSTQAPASGGKEETGQVGLPPLSGTV